MYNNINTVPIIPVLTKVRTAVVVPEHYYNAIHNNNKEKKNNN